MKTGTAAICALVACAAALFAPLAMAQSVASYPSRPIRLVIPFAPGGALDYVAKIIEPRWRELAGQDIVIVNRPGASGNTGLEAAAKAAPDGYTLLLGNVAVAVNPSLYKSSLGAVPMRDFVPITQIADLPSALVAHPSLPAKSAKELVAYAKARPDKLAFASPGAASVDRLEMELFLQSSGIRVIHRPYEGGVGPAVKSLLGGETSMMFVPLPTVAGEVRAGKLKLLGLATPRRVDAFSTVPTLAEQGFPQMTNGAWQGVFAPKGTPPRVVAKLHATLVQVMAAPRVNFHLNAAGIHVVTSKTPEAFAAFVRSETERWEKVVTASGATPQ